MTAPKLRFKEFDGDWKIKKLGNCFNLISGYAFPSSASVDKGAKWLKIADVGIQEMTPSSLSYLPHEFLEKYPQFIVSKEDYVIALTRPILNKKLKIAKVGSSYDGALLNQRVAKIQTNKNDLGFIYSLLQKSKTVEELENSISGTDPPNLSLNDVKDIRLGFPSIEEQTKIATFLSAVDEKISQLTQKHELLSQYKQGMMQKLFSQQIRFKADDGSEFGEWKKVKFSDKFKFHQTNSYSRALLSEQGEIMNIHYGDIHTKFSTLFDISKEVVPFLSSEVNTNKFAEDQFLQVGDLVIADASEDYKDIGKALEIIHLNNQKVVAGLHTYIARPVHPFALGFCGYLMQTFEVREQIKKLATGISVLGISKTNIGKVEIKVPCLKEQTKIANFLSAIDQKLEIVAQQIEQAKQWKKGLLQQMFV